MMPGSFNFIVFALLKFSLSSSVLGVKAMLSSSAVPGTKGAVTTTNNTLIVTTSKSDDLTLVYDIWDNDFSPSTMDASPSAKTHWTKNNMTAPTGSTTNRLVESGDIANKTNINKAFSWSPVHWSWVNILQLISAVVGVVGNFLVIVVLFQRRRKSRSTDTLIGGLACADFLTSIFLIPIPWPSYVPFTWAGEVYCRVIFTQSLLWISITASAYLLMSISIELYIAVVYPFRFNDIITRRRVSIFIVIVWLLSVLSGFFVFIIYAVDESVNGCTEQYMFDHAQTIVAYYWFCLRLIVPCLTMLVTQIFIARELSRQSRNFKGISNMLTNAKCAGGAPTFHIVARNRVLKMMLIVILIYVACWAPNQIAYLGYNLGWVPESYLNSTLHRMLTVLGFYNSCANPFIYTARYPEFRQALKHILTCTSPENAPLFDKEDIAKKPTVDDHQGHVIDI